MKNRFLRRFAIISYGAGVNGFQTNSRRKAPTKGKQSKKFKKRYPPKPKYRNTSLKKKGVL